MNLKQEFSLLASLLVVTVILSICTAFIIYNWKYLLQEMKNNEVNIFKGYVEMSEGALGMNDELLLLDYINITKHINKNVVYMIFRNIDGHVLGKHPAYVPERSTGQDAEKEFEDILYTAPDGIMISDISQRIIINRELVGVAQIGYSQEILLAEVKKTLKKTIEKIAGIAVIFIFLSILASVFLANKMLRPIKKLTTGAKLIGEGDLNQKIIVKSSNELGELAMEFNKMAVKLKELDEMKDYFVSSVSHELKSPLSYIKGYIELFLEDNETLLSKDHKEYFNIIKDNITRLSHFISDILELARIKSGHMLLNKKHGDLKDIAQDTIDFCRPMAQEKKISISVEASDNLPSVNCDREKINHVLQNLIDNALKFTPEGGSISIVIEEKCGYVEVSVNDTGIGIPKDKLEIVFNKFQQIKENMDKISNIKGTGLGLAIVKGIIEAHGEKIRVESKLNKGSSFIFTLSL